MRKTVILVHYSSNYSGSTMSGRLVAKALASIGVNVRVVFGFDGPFVKIYRAEGYQVDVVNHKSWLRTNRTTSFAKYYFDERKAASAFRSYYKSVNPDAVYVNSLVSLAPSIAASRAGIPLIWHLRELYASNGGEMKCPRWLGKAFVRNTIIRNANKVIACSKDVALDIMGTIDSDKVEVVYNAAGTSFFDRADGKNAYRTLFGLPTGVPLIGVPGTLRPVKGHLFLFKSIQRLHKEKPECHFAITGHGAYEYVQVLHDYIHDNSMDGYVHFLGRIEDMASFYKGCDVICIPAVCNSFGRTVIEAFASQVPLVATSGCKEIVRDGENGILVRYGDAQQLADAIVKLLADDELSRKIVVAARKDAEYLFHERKYVRHVGDIVSKVIA